MAAGWVYFMTNRPNGIRYLDKIAVAEVPFRFVERLVILDSRKVDTLLVLPL